MFSQPPSPPLSVVNGQLVVGTGTGVAGSGTGLTWDGSKLTLAPTWNAAGTAFTVLAVNVTNTASAAGSKLLDLQVGGVTLASVDRSGYQLAQGFAVPGTGLFGFIPALGSTVNFTGLRSTSQFAELYGIGSLLLRANGNDGVVTAPYAIVVGGTGGVGISPLTVKAVASATANTFETQTSAGGVILAADSTKMIVRQPGGTAGTNEGQLYHDGSSLVFLNKRNLNGTLLFATETPTSGSAAALSVRMGGASGSNRLGVFNDRLAVASGQFVGWASTSNSDVALDTALARNAAGVVEVNTGTAGAVGGLVAGLGVFRQPGGTAGTHEVREYHDGTGGFLQSMSGGLSVLTPDSTTTLFARTSSTASHRVTIQHGTGGQNTTLVVDDVAQLGGLDGMSLDYTSKATRMAAAWVQKWYNANFNGTADIGLARNAAGILEANNGIAGTWAGFRCGMPAVGTPAFVAKTIAGATATPVEVQSSAGTALMTFSTSGTTIGRITFPATASTYIEGGDSSIVTISDKFFVRQNSNVVGVANNVQVGWSASSSGMSSIDTALSRFAAGVVGAPAVFLANQAGTPATPTGGGILYTQAGVLKYVGIGGTVTTIAAA